MSSYTCLNLFVLVIIKLYLIYLRAHAVKNALLPTVEYTICLSSIDIVMFGEIYLNILKLVTKRVISVYFREAGPSLSVLVKFFKTGPQIK